MFCGKLRGFGLLRRPNFAAPIDPHQRHSDGRHSLMKVPL